MSPASRGSGVVSSQQLPAGATGMPRGQVLWKPWVVHGIPWTSSYFLGTRSPRDVLSPVGRQTVSCWLPKARA